MHDTPLGDKDRPAGGPNADESDDILASIRRIVSEEDGRASMAGAEPPLRSAPKPEAKSEPKAEPEPEEPADEAETDVLLLTPDLRVEEDDDEDAEDEPSERMFILRGPTHRTPDEDDEPSEDDEAPHVTPGFSLRAEAAAEEADAEQEALRGVAADWTRALSDDDDDEDGTPAWIRAGRGDDGKGRGGRVTPLRRSTPHPASPLRGRDGARREDQLRRDLRADRDDDEDGGSLFAQSQGPAERASGQVELEELIRKTLREELSGPMGDRISSNIRSIIQREVRKAVEDALSNR